MGRFTGLLKVTFQEGLVYRTQFLADVSAGCVYLLSCYYLWRAVYAGRSEIEGISLASMVAYALVSTLIGFVVRQDVNVVVGDKVHGGEIAIELTKPINYQLVLLYTAAGQAIFNLVFKALPVVLVFAHVLDIAVPMDPGRVLLATLSCALGFVAYFLIDLSLGSLAFWITQTYGVNMFKNVLMSLCAGGIMPLDFFPALVRDALAFLPFKGCFYTPLSILLGIEPQGGLPMLIAEQLGWIVVLLLVSQVLWRKALPRVVVLGG